MNQKTIETWRARNYNFSPQISFIIQSHNRSECVLRLVDKLRAWVGGEIIVIDDGSSTEHTSRLVGYLTQGNEFLLRANDLYEVITYDRAIYMSRGRYVALLQDDDDFANLDWVTEAIGHFMAHPEMAILGGRNGLRLLPFETTGDGRPGPFTMTGDIGQRANLLKFDMLGTGGGAKGFKFVQIVNRAPMLLRRDMFMERLGHINQEFAPCMWDDAEISLRVWSLGMQVGWYNAGFQIEKMGQGGMRAWNVPLQQHQDEVNVRRIYAEYGSQLDTLWRKVNVAQNKIQVKSAAPVATASDKPLAIQAGEKIRSGDAVGAITMLGKSVAGRLSAGQSPDAAEWAELILALLCVGELETAMKYSSGFPQLRSRELDRVRWLAAAASNGNGDLYRRHFATNVEMGDDFKSWLETSKTTLKAYGQLNMCKLIVEHDIALQQAAPTASQPSIAVAEAPPMIQFAPSAGVAPSAAPVATHRAIRTVSGASMIDAMIEKLWQGKASEVEAELAQTANASRSMGRMPDPVIVAYYVVSMICQGKLCDAAKVAMEARGATGDDYLRARWAAITMLNGMRTEKPPASCGAGQSDYRMATISYDQWIADVRGILAANGQELLGEVVDRCTPLEVVPPRCHVAPDWYKSINFASTVETHEVLYIFKYLPWRKYLDWPVVDIGSHYGTVSENFLHVGFKDVHSFEPNPDNNRVQSSRLAEYINRGWLKLYNAASSDADGQADMYISSDTYLHTLNPQWKDDVFKDQFPDNKIVKVEACRVGPYLRKRGCNRLFFAKIDTEGFEFQAINGLINAGEGSLIPKGLMFEVNHNMKDAAESCLRLLKEKGFKKFVWWLKYGSSLVLDHEVRNDAIVPPSFHKIKMAFYGNVIALNDELSAEMFG